MQLLQAIPSQWIQSIGQCTTFIQNLSFFVSDPHLRRGRLLFPGQTKGLIPLLTTTTAFRCNTAFALRSPVFSANPSCPFPAPSGPGPVDRSLDSPSFPAPHADAPPTPKMTYLQTARPKARPGRLRECRAGPQTGLLGWGPRQEAEARPLTLREGSAGTLHDSVPSRGGLNGCNGRGLALTPPTPPATVPAPPGLTGTEFSPCCSEAMTRILRKSMAASGPGEGEAAALLPPAPLRARQRRHRPLARPPLRSAPLGSARFRPPPPTLYITSPRAGVTPSARHFPCDERLAAAGEGRRRRGGGSGASSSSCLSAPGEPRGAAAV